jgi:L-threonylcarbamoyladenylate synthase
MNTVVLPLDPRDPDPAVLDRAAEVLRRGGLVAFPTETVYGLGANALDAASVRRIFAAKGRPAHNPLIVHVSDAAAAREVVTDWPAKAEALTRRFWPGPLTLVLPRAEVVPAVVSAGMPTVAVRAPNHPVALALLRHTGLPLAAPSANRSTELSPTRAEHVLRGLGGRIEMILDAGPCPGGIESTVLDLTADPPRLLRPGLLGAAELEEVTGPIDLSPPTPGGALPSPGMLPRHYAPRTTLECVEGDAEGRMEELRRQGLRAVRVRFGGRQEGDEVVLPGDARAAARELYAVLHELDAGGFERIVVELPPAGEEWRALRDRLLRAASGS